MRIIDELPFVLFAITLTNMENGPLVSIGLCVRDGEKYLREALDSLLGQTHKNLELIISDNASADGTQAIAEAYARKEKRIRYIRQKENIGSFANYDFVRQESRGDYFLYASNDDLWAPRFIEACVAHFAENTDALVAFPNFCTFDDSGRVMKYQPIQYFPYPRDLYSRLKSYLLSRSQYGKSTIIYGLQKKGTLADRVLMDEVRGDMLYVFRMLAYGYFAAVPETLFFKRLPVQFKTLNNKSKQPTLRFLAAMPDDFPYEFVDDWLRTRKDAIKGRGFVAAAKEFIGDRIQAVKYTFLYLKFIFKIPALTMDEKIRLSLWNKYAYLKSLLWYGHV